MVQRVSVTQVESVFDILDQTAFLFELGAIPGANGDESLALKCQNVIYAGYSNTSYEMAVHGHMVRFRGIKAYPRSMNVTYFEDQKMLTRQVFDQWHEWIVGTVSGNSQSFKAGYAIDPILRVFDHIGGEVASIRYKNFFLTEAPDVTFDGGSSQPVVMGLTFSYDRIKESTLVAFT